MTWTKFASRGAVAIVAAVAGVISYGHIRAVALAAGETELAALLLPLSVDGLIVASTAALLANLDPRGRRLARLALWVGIAATIGGNVASAEPGPVPMVVAATPAVAFLLSVEVLRHLIRAGRLAGVEQGGVPSGDGHGEMPSADTAAPAPRAGKRQPARKSARQRVETLSAKMPSAPTSELAARLKLSEATVRRYRPAPPDGILSANGQRHEGTPDLAEAVAS